MLAERELQDMVRRVVGRVLAERGRERHPAGQPELGASARPKGVHVDVHAPDGAPRPLAPQLGGDARPAAHGPELVTVECLADTPQGGTLRVPAGARVTPLAREEAFRRGIRLTEGPGVAAASGAAGRMRVAVGADHGGFQLKQAVVEWLREAGCAVQDLGTHDANAVDYPDLAQAVAEAVAGGRADLGVCIDGAGIGSAMAANKVPGVRAANAWNVASAKNAREHNFANVLTLGAGMLAPAAAFEIVRAFLATAQGPERHARRVAKITAIERRYARTPAPDAARGPGGGAP
jgi:ribose 5-phosphate isomerase B